MAPASRPHAPRIPPVHPRTVDQRNARLLYLSTALIGVPFGGIVSFLPVFPARLGASPTLIGWYNSAPAMLWCIAVAGIGIGLFDLMLAMIPTERQPRFGAVHGIVRSGCIFLGPLLGAAIAGQTSTRTALIIAGVAQAVTTVPFLLLPKDV